MTAATTSPSCEFIRRFRHDKKLWSGQFSADGARIFVQDDTFTESGMHKEGGYIWDVHSGDLLYAGSISVRDCSANYDYVIPQGKADNPTTAIINIVTGEPVFTVEGSCRFSGELAHQVIVSPFKVWRPPEGDGWLRSGWVQSGNIEYAPSYLYDLKAGEIVSKFNFLPDDHHIYTLNDDGSLLLSGRSRMCSRKLREVRNEFFVWGISSGKQIAHLAFQKDRAIKGHQDGVQQVLFLPGRKNRVLTITATRVYSEGLDPMAAILWDVESAEPTAQILCGGDRTANPNPHSYACDINHHFTFASDGKWFAALRADGYTGPNEDMMRVFDMQYAGVEAAQLAVEAPQRIAGAPNAPYVAATSFRSPLVRIFEIGPNREVAHCAAPTFMSDTPAMDVSFAPASPDGQFVLTTHEGGDAVLWRMPHWV
jgi:hypothetical protein